MFLRQLKAARGSGKEMYFFRGWDGGGSVGGGVWGKGVIKR